MENKSYILEVNNNNNKIKLRDKLERINSNKMRLLRKQNGGFTKLTEIRQSKNIVDEVKILTMIKTDFSNVVLDTADSYIDNFQKMSTKYNLEIKFDFEKLVDNKEKVQWVRKMHSQINLFPPTLRKKSIDIISNAPELISATIEELTSPTIVGYFRESNLVEDFLLCSSSKNWWSCAEFATLGLGTNSGFIYAQSKYDKIVYLFNTEEEAIKGVGNAEARFITSHVNGEIITHRVYSSVKHQSNEIKVSYLSNYKNDDNYIDYNTRYRVNVKKMPKAYPDIAVSSQKISLLKKEQENKAIKSIKEEYENTNTSMFFKST